MPSAARVERGISGPLVDRWLEGSDARARVAGRKDPLNISGERGGWRSDWGVAGRGVVGGGLAGSRVGIAAGELMLWLRQRGVPRRWEAAAGLMRGLVGMELAGTGVSKARLGPEAGVAAVGSGWMTAMAWGEFIPATARSGSVAGS